MTEVRRRQEAWMHQAIAEAARAEASGDVPVGALVFDADGGLIARGHNTRESHGDPTGHAEVVAIRAAAEVLQARAEATAAAAPHADFVSRRTTPKDWRLTGCTLVVTLEPCPMCAGAIVLARVPRVAFGAWDPKAGAAGSVLDVLAEPKLNWRPDVAGGLLADESAGLLRAFFAARR
jgi:tRNA(adenine34) deaminase